jgi:AraC-like DNA-binding protein
MGPQCPAGSTLQGHPEAMSLANPFRERLALIETIRESRSLLQLVLPVEEMESKDNGSHWWHYGFSCSLGSIRMGAMLLPPATMVVSEQNDLSVFLGYGGEQRFQQDSRTWRCQADGCLMLAGEPYSSVNTLASSVAWRLMPEQLLHTAMAMAGVSQIPLQWRRSLRQSQEWWLTDSSVAPLQLMLRKVIDMANQVVGYSQSLVDQLQLDDQIYRLMAAMLLPELREESPLDRLTQREQQGRDSFDELIDYIKANLSEPLNLTMLESRIHYSRRALQYAFKERLGCTATQWIRNQRLDLARKRLQNPMAGETVASIALACGYRSMNLFSLDFQQRFHVKPSHLLREARSSLPPAV